MSECDVVVRRFSFNGEPKAPAVAFGLALNELVAAPPRCVQVAESPGAVAMIARYRLIWQFGSAAFSSAIPASVTFVPLRFRPVSFRRPFKWTRPASLT